MMNYDHQKHHRRSIRLADYDYSKGGAYFVTICTRNGEPILSTPPKPVPAVGVALAATHSYESPPSPNPEPDTAHLLELTPIGEIVERKWLTLPEHFQMVSLDEYVIMPNHLHGIVVINEQDQSGHSVAVKRVGARPTPTLGAVVGAFKSMSIHDVLAYIEKNGLDMIGKIWQRNYFERIIRNERDLDNIRTYIRNNPRNWERDDENPVR
jgi:REP element-mobilizing transposase RayT